MKHYDLDINISGVDLEKALEAGDNITFSIVDCKLRIDSTGGSGGPSTGIKYHLKSTDNITVPDCFEYLVGCDFILDAGAVITVDAGGRLTVHEAITNDGVIFNDGIIKIGL